MAEDRITLLAEPIEISEVRAEPCETPADVRREHGTGFYVLAGEVTLRVEQRELTAGVGAWAFVPPNVPHAISASGESRARFLELRVPAGAGSSGMLVRTGAAAGAIEVSGNRIAFLADADETGGALGAIEFTAPRAFAGPPAHIHRGFHDIVLVLDGALELELRDETRTLGAGALAHAPPGVPHTFSNPSDAPLRFLNLYVPGGFERFFRERAAGSVDPAALTARYDWERA